MEWVLLAYKHANLGIQGQHLIRREQGRYEIVLLGRKVRVGDVRFRANEQELEGKQRIVKGPKEAWSK